MSKINAKMISTDGTMTVIIGGRPYAVSEDHPKYDVLVESLNEDDADKFMEWINYEEKVEEYVTGQLDGTGIEVRDGSIWYGGQVLHNVMCDRTIRFMERGLPYNHMLAFMGELMENPSMRSVQQLYPFLEKENIPITDDGHFLGYKVVHKYHGADFKDQFGQTVTEGDLVDKHSSSVRNNIGDTPSVPRNMVDDNPNSACSYGLHVGSLAYAGPNGNFKSSGDVCLIVKVNPKNVVSIPTSDANKLRCCEYEVVSLYEDLDNDLAVKELPDDNFILDDDDEDRSVSVEDLYIEDNITFDYSTNGVWKRRHVVIESIGVDNMVGELLEDDPSYEYGGMFRSFRLDEMEDITYE